MAMPRGNFRGYTATAPLKQIWLTLKGKFLGIFPWLHSHGPIEAGCSSLSMIKTFPYFRGYTATAPLKHWLAVILQPSQWHFRGYTATAPLKVDGRPDLRRHGRISVATQPRPH